MIAKKKIGIDVGGSHITASIVEVQNTAAGAFQGIHKAINSKDSAHTILQAISHCIRELVPDESEIDTVGIAFPGPFDYEKGISAITGVGEKFGKTFGLHIAQALKNMTNCNQVPFYFSNDAHCFAAGANHSLKLTGQRKIFLTLGTGFGSAFMEGDSLLMHHAAMPASCALYDQPFSGAVADDFISTRWLLNAYTNSTGAPMASVKEMAEQATDAAKKIFEQFGHNLGTILLPWLNLFDCDDLVIGGNIARAEHLFGPALKAVLATRTKPVNLVYCTGTEACILKGAVIIADQKNKTYTAAAGLDAKRKTTQALLPETLNETGGDDYTIYPSFHTDARVYNGFFSLAEKIGDEKLIVIDGFAGVQWENFREQLNQMLLAKNKSCFWYDINSCLKSPEAINELLKENLNGDDPVFGKKYTGALADFFDAQKLQLLCKDDAADICIVYGTGAALSQWAGKLIYADLPKNELQYRMRAGAALNIGCEKTMAYTQMYKRSYFADWPLLNAHKAQLLAHIDYIVDEQRLTAITWMEGRDFRAALNTILEQPFRARPWFEAGIWGGQWMKEKFTQLNQTEINYAWSFELITPENGIVIEGSNNLLEVSFDFLLYFDNTKLLGKAAARFGNEFPIRFDFLDTFNGGNLSVQCHPEPAYIKEHFGENFTQDETYYILDCAPGAEVYLGFQEDINAAEFKAALTDAQATGIAMPVEKYIQQHTAHKHDLFLIPNGTVHASGKNNLVLEISSTPYIFTFKMYDWLRLDLNGQPRPINIEHAFNNLNFGRKGAYVTDQLISKQVVQEEWADGKKIQLSTHAEHFYAVDRYEFFGAVTIQTHQQCHICMLVEGELLDVTVHEKRSTFHYAETFVIPAGVESYVLQQRGTQKAFVVVAYVKEACC